jgi:hypothetical protein
MALIHKATLVPSKLEMLAAWLPTRPWFRSGDGDLTKVGSFRFDDPAGKVGIEFFLVRAGTGPVHLVPLSYRGAPLDEDAALITTMEHSVLGPRWVYDGCGDPVLLGVLINVIRCGLANAPVEISADGATHAWPEDASANGTGALEPIVGLPTIAERIDGPDATTVVTDAGRLTVLRTADGAASVTNAPDALQLLVRWPGQADLPFATLSR